MRERREESGPGGGRRRGGEREEGAEREQGERAAGVEGDEVVGEEGIRRGREGAGNAA